MTRAGGAIAGLAGLSALCAQSSSLTPAQRRRRFEQWIVEYQIAESNLCRYYRYGPHANEESPLATSYAMLLFNDAHPETADRMADGLIALQQRFASNHHVGGGVPSIANNDSLLFYASDALAAIKAMMTAYKRSRNPVHLRAASGFVEFVHRLADGERSGFLDQNLNFPMQYVRPNGEYQNWLVPNISMLFWDALREYAEVAGDAATGKLFDAGRAFLLRSVQAPNGAYYDHYDPGYPPRAYSSERWRWFKIETDGRRIGIGDNMMMSALGALRLGDTAGVDRFLAWTKPDDGAFYAYMDVETGGSGFHYDDHRYYDVVCSGMYYRLLTNRDRLDNATRTQLERVFALSAGEDGGYRWGLRVAGGGWVQDAAEALVTGYWIVEAS